MQTQFEDFKVGQTVKNIKTAKNWMITDFLTGFSNIRQKSPDQFNVRLSDGSKSQIVSVERLRKNYEL